MAQNTKWTMNDTQKKFMEVLADYPAGATLFELKLAGYNFKSGSINALITKGKVETDGEREFKCDVVYAGKVVGQVTKKGKVYKVIGAEPVIEPADVEVSVGDVDADEVTDIAA